MNDLKTPQAVAELIKRCFCMQAEEAANIVRVGLEDAGAKDIIITSGPSGNFTVEYEDSDTGRSFRVGIETTHRELCKETTVPKIKLSSEREPESGIEEEVAKKALKVVFSRRRNLNVFSLEDQSTVLRDLDEEVLKDMENNNKLEVIGANATKSSKDESVFSLTFSHRRKNRTLLVRVKKDQAATAMYVA